VVQKQRENKDGETKIKNEKKLIDNILEESVSTYYVK
jgi:hypothetical protein